jgi:hypothetical protein
MDLRAWRDRWNDAALPRIPNLPGESPSRPWPLLGMLVLGLVAGAALGGYAASRRPQIKRLAAAAHRMGDELAGMRTAETANDDDVVTVPRSNHRRKATSEV